MSNYVPPTTPIGGPTGPSSNQFPAQQSYPPPPPQKGSGVWKWVLIGCGSFIVIGTVIFVLGSWFVWNKAKQAGLDADLLEKKPGLAIAKMAAALDKDVEVVSTDDDKGEITVRNKKTGETMTLTFDEVEKGKIKFKQGDKEMTMEAKPDESGGGSLEVKTPEGSATLGSGSAASIPGWLPSYPGSPAVGTYSAHSAEGVAGGFTFVTTDSIEKVSKFYEDNLKSGGLSVKTNSVQSNGVATLGTVTGEDEGKKRTAQVTAFSAEGKTQVTVAYVSK